MKHFRLQTLATVAAVSIPASLFGDALLLLQEESAPADVATATPTDLPTDEKSGFQVVDYRLSGGFVHAQAAHTLVVAAPRAATDARRQPISLCTAAGRALLSCGSR